MEEEPLVFYQHYLDRLGEALIARDAPTFLRHLFLPLVIVTETSTIRIEDRATCERHFHGFCDALAAQGADAYTRVARTAVLDGPDSFKGTHDTYITSRGKLVVPVFANEMTLVRQGDIWGSVEIQHHARFVSWPDLLPRAGAE